MNTGKFFNMFIDNMGNTRYERQASFNLFFNMLKDLDENQAKVVLKSRAVDRILKQELRKLDCFEFLVGDNATFIADIYPKLPEIVKKHIQMRIIPTLLEEINIRSFRSILDKYLSQYIVYKNSGGLPISYYQRRAMRIFTLIDIDYILSNDKYPKIKKEIMRSMLKN